MGADSLGNEVQETCSDVFSGITFSSGLYLLSIQRKKKLFGISILSSYFLSMFLIIFLQWEQFLRKKSCYVYGIDHCEGRLDNTQFLVTEIVLHYRGFKTLQL